MKTDKRDTRKRSEQLEAGHLQRIRIPREGEEQRRLLSRTRSQRVRQRPQVQNQICMSVRWLEEPPKICFAEYLTFSMTG